MSSSYVDQMLEEARSYAEDTDGPDYELVAQIRLVRTSRNDSELKSRVAHLRRMLTLSYADEDELPVPPADA